MMSVEQFAALLLRKVGAIKAAKKMALRAGCNIIRDEAKSAIGTYKYGWPRLDPKTVARKRTGDSPLLETGALRASIRTLIVSDDEGYVVTDDPKAGFHEFGTSKMPPRPFMRPAGQLKGAEAARVAGQHIGVAIMSG